MSNKEVYSPPGRRVSTIAYDNAADSKKSSNQSSEVLRKYAAFKRQSAIINNNNNTTEMPENRKSLHQKLMRNCHFAAYKGDIGYIRKAVSEIPSIINHEFNYIEQPLLSAVEERDPYYLPPAQIPKLIRGALQVGNPSHMSLDQRWLLSRSFSRSSLLHYACAGDQLAVVHFLVENGADRSCVNAADKEPDYYTIDERVREYLWTAPKVTNNSNVNSSTPKRSHRRSIFNSGGDAVSYNEDNSPSSSAQFSPQQQPHTISFEMSLPMETQVQPQRPPPSQPQQQPPLVIRKSITAMFDSTPEEELVPQTQVSSATATSSSHRVPPPPPPRSSMTASSATTIASITTMPTGPTPPRSLPPPPTKKIEVVCSQATNTSFLPSGRSTSISQLIERTRKSIRVEENAVSDADKIATSTPFSELRSSMSGNSRPSISKRRLSRVIQSRRHRDSKSEHPESGDEDEQDNTVSDLLFLDLPTRDSFTKPIVIRRLSVQNDGQLKDTSFQVDDSGGLVECKQETIEEQNVTMKTKGGGGGVLSKGDVSMSEVHESVEYLEAWEGKIASRDSKSEGGADTISIMRSALYDPSQGLEGARETAKLFARAKAIEREEKRKGCKRQSVMHIYKNMLPPMESVASQMIRQHSSGLSAMQILFKSSANNDQSVLDTYQAQLDAAVAASAITYDDNYDSFGPTGIRNKQNKKINMSKLTFRELIWCKAGMGMNITDKTTSTGDDARLRAAAYKHGVSIMKKEFHSYAFREHWEAIAFYERKSELINSLKEEMMKNMDKTNDETLSADNSVAVTGGRDSNNNYDRGSVLSDVSSEGSGDTSRLVLTIGGNDDSYGNIDSNGSDVEEWDEEDVRIQT